MYKFIKTKDPDNEFDRSHINHIILYDATLPELLEDFLRFLKACGFHFDINDKIEVVEVE